MIAPHDFSSETDLFLYLGPIEREAFNFDPESIPEDLSLEIPRYDWWAVWNCQILITDPDREQIIALFVNHGSAMSFVCTGLGSDFDGLIGEFEASFVRYLQASGLQLASEVSFNLTPMQGSGDDAEHACLQMEPLVEVAIAALQAGTDLDSIHQKLHQTRVDPFDNETPEAAFRRLLRDNPPVGVELGESPDEDVPF